MTTASVAVGRERHESTAGRLLRSIEYEGYLVGVLALAVVVISATVGRAFWSTTNLSSVLLNAAIATIPAIGMTLVIITAGIDVSIGALVGVVATVAGLGFEHGWPFVAVIVAAIVVGIAGGALNGAVIAWGGVPPIIMTLGTLSLYRALVYQLLGGVWISTIPSEMTRLVVLDRIGPVPYSFVLAVVLVVVFSWVMRKRPVGRRIYAVGDNAEAARTAGLRVKLIKFSCYALLGGLTGIAALMFIGQSPPVQATTGHNFELTVIAAAVVGGTSILGGEGKVWGGLFGALLVEVVEDATILYHVSSFWQQIVLGAMIVVAVSIGVVPRRRTRAAWGFR
jgi:ribose/xylose/arabinose/galactoside ABC-type transport system permease subunit